MRDECGRVLASFAYSYGVLSNAVAEGHALLDGLRLAKQLGIQK